MSEPSTDAPPARLRVAVVFGGRSAEHAISCVSAGSVLAAIDRDRYDVVPVGITTEGRWVLAPDEPEKLAITGGVLPSVAETGAGVVLAGDPTAGGLVVREPGRVPEVLGRVDVVLPLLHGPYGEDGTIQGLLELSGVPYVGSGVFASAAAMDKGHMKSLMAAAGLPVGPWEVITPRDWDRGPEAALDRVTSRLEFPVFVKPCRAGSSFGITRVTEPSGLRDAVEVARGHDPRVIVEEGIAGREIECGVLDGIDGADPEPSVVAEIRVQGAHEFYDFEAKYLDATEFDVPAELPHGASDRTRELAVQAYLALGCEGLARVDFFLRPDGEVVLNEVNTMPGFTPASMFPRVWAASGLDYPALVDRLLRSALARPTGLR